MIEIHRRNAGFQCRGPVAFLQFGILPDLSAFLLATPINGSGFQVASAASLRNIGRAASENIRLPGGAPGSAARGFGVNGRASGLCK
jgi:hypothetical protein